MMTNICSDGVLTELHDEILRRGVKVIEENQRQWFPGQLLFTDETTLVCMEFRRNVKKEQFYVGLCGD